MSTLVREEAAAGGQPPPLPARRATRARGRGSSWRASWRVALRMARRDVRRHRGRSLVVLLMVGLPAMLVVAALTVGATSQVTGAEKIPSVMGSTEAAITGPVPERITQGADAEMGYGSAGEDPAEPIPGYSADGTPFDNADAIGRLVDGRAIAYSVGEVRVQSGDRARTLQGLAIADPAGVGEKITLLSGRWPTEPGEALLSRSAVAAGLPSSGTLQQAGAKGEALEIVGTARALGDWGMRYEIVTLAPVWGESWGGGWLVERETPVPWSEVTELNTYGLPVTSAEVLRHPPALSELDPRMADQERFGQARESMAYALLGGVLVILLTLLIGPAFAVSAARQRRTLALAAANGATTPQLRRTVLAQALVLGGLSAAVAVVLGVLGAIVFLQVAEAREWMTVGPLDIPWGQVVGVVAVAVISSVAAALLPATRLGRLDIAGTMKGIHVPPPPSRVLPMAGILLAVVGGAAIITGARTTGAEVQILLGAVALIVGALLTVPTILHLLGHVGGRLPLPLRLATRDLARHRSRSAPTIAAVLAGTAALTIGLVGGTSDTEQRRQEYVPATIVGEARLSSPGDPQDAEAEIERFRAAVPDLRFAHSWMVGTSTADAADTAPFVAVQPAGCTPEQTFRDREWEARQASGAAPAGPELEDPSVWGSPCQLIGENSPTARSIAVLGADEIVRRMGLTGADAETVRGGGAVVMTLPSDEGVVTDGQVSIVHGTREGEDMYAEDARLTDVETLRLPAVVRERDLESMPATMSAGLLVPREVAQAQGWPLLVSTLTVYSPTGPISEVQEERLTATAGEDGWVQVERGFVNDLWMILAVLIGLFTALLLVVTMTSAALSLAEQERDQATLAAVGASRGTRRLMAGSQAWVLALVGVVLGVAVGLVPGIAITYPLTGMTWDQVTGAAITDDPTTVIPWPVLAGMAVVVPLVAGALATLAIRRVPTATRRTT